MQGIGCTALIEFAAPSPTGQKHRYPCCVGAASISGAQGRVMKEEKIFEAVEQQLINDKRKQADEFIRWDMSPLASYFRYDFWNASDGIAVLAGCCYGSNKYTLLDYMDADEANYCLHRYEDLRDVWKHTRHKKENNDDDVFELEFAPAYFIDWARSKGERIDWLDWAIDAALYSPEPKHESYSELTDELFAKNREIAALNNLLIDGDSERADMRFEIERMQDRLRNQANILAAGTMTKEAAQHEQIATAPALPPIDPTAGGYPLELATALQAWQAVSATEGKGKPKARIKAWLDSNTKLSNEAKERIAVVCNWEKLGGATRSE
jgi:hypothetical protein